jgi:hypothetical protein
VRWGEPRLPGSGANPPHPPHCRRNGSPPSPPASGRRGRVELGASALPEGGR